MSLGTVSLSDLENIAYIHLLYFAHLNNNHKNDTSMVLILMAKLAINKYKATPTHTLTRNATPIVLLCIIEVFKHVCLNISYKPTFGL